MWGMEKSAIFKTTTQTFVSRRNAACWYDEGTQEGGTPFTIYYSHYYSILSLFHTTQWHFIPHKHTNMLIHASSFFIVWPNESQTKTKKQRKFEKNKYPKSLRSILQVLSMQYWKKFAVHRETKLKENNQQEEEQKKVTIRRLQAHTPKKKTKIMFGLQLHKTRQANNEKNWCLLFFSSFRFHDKKKISFVNCWNGWKAVQKKKASVLAQGGMLRTTK